MDYHIAITCADAQSRVRQRDDEPDEEFAIRFKALESKWLLMATIDGPAFRQCSSTIVASADPSMLLPSLFAAIRAMGQSTGSK